jgi:hypothetical protein
MGGFMRRFLFTLAAAAALAGPSRAGDEPVAQWVWSSTHPAENESACFRREFELPADVTEAEVTIACDDWHRLWVNGQDLGTGDQWNQARRIHVTAHLRTGGRNVIAVEARNDKGAAGLALRFRALRADGQKLYVMSDAHWQFSLKAPDQWQTPDFQPADWEKAVVIGKMGIQPWGDLFAPAPAAGDATAGGVSGTQE